jgi:hypothetical protein
LLRWVTAALSGLFALYQDMSNPYRTETLPVPGNQPYTGDDFGTNLGEKLPDDLYVVSETRVSVVELPCNVGRQEQAIRLGMGTVLLGVAAFAPLSRGWRIGLAAFGVMELVTGASRYCPVWHAMGIDTRRAAL